MQLTTLYNDYIDIGLWGLLFQHNYNDAAQKAADNEVNKA